MKATINFFKEEVNFRLSDQVMLRKWIIRIIAGNGYKTENLNFIFCKDSYLKKINKQYLGHNFNTDIITFDNSLLKKTVNGDVFISIDSIKINAKKFDTNFKDELQRVMAHGVLHLLGFSDKKSDEKAEMRKLEDLWLSKRKL